jgi:glutamine synthetase type III
MFIFIEVEAERAGFEMAVLQKRILHRKAKVSEVLVFLLHESPWPGATGAGQSLSTLTGAQTQRA